MHAPRLRRERAMQRNDVAGCKHLVPRRIEFAARRLAFVRREHRHHPECLRDLHDALAEHPVARWFAEPSVALLKIPLNLAPLVLICVSEVAHLAQPAPARKIEMDKTLDIVKTEAEIARLMAETAKLNLESRWVPFVWASGLILAVMTITKFFFE